MKQAVILFLISVFWTYPATASSMPVFVSIVPQQYFAEKIAKELADVSVMVEPGNNPHNYEPKPRQMVKLSQAKLYFAIGVTFEETWLDKFADINPEMQIVHTEAGIEKIPMKAHHHDNGAPEHDHDAHGIKDPHIWLSPPLVKIIAQNMLNALKKADPAHKAEYEANYDTFVRELNTMDAEFRAIFSKAKGRQFMVFHPAWGYFAHTYGLEQIPVELEGKNPKPAALQHLIQHARKEGIRVIFVQPQFSAKSAEVIANAIGGQIAIADPLAQDWAENMHQVAEKFKSALK